MYLLKKFFCCCELETGGLIIGWLNLICSLLFIIGEIVLLTGDSAPQNQSQMWAITHFVSYITVGVVSIFLIRGVKNVSLFLKSSWKVLTTKLQRIPSFIQIAFVFFFVQWLLTMVFLFISLIYFTLASIIVQPYFLWTLYSLKVKFNEL